MTAADAIARNAISAALTARYGWIPLSVREEATTAALDVAAAWMARHRQFLEAQRDCVDVEVRAEAHRQLAELDGVNLP